MISIIEVTAPSRLHFGLLSFGQSGTRQFGGAGLMVDQPGLRLRVSAASEFVAVGELSARATAVVEHWARLARLPRLPECRVEILESPGEHLGLGTGTQLALSVVAGIQAFRGGPPLVPTVLATLAGRGARSAIGTYGFCHGGLLVETGKLGKQLLAPLERRVEIPTAWRFVLVHASEQPGLSGADEHVAFDDLPPVPRATTARLLDELSQELLPAVVTADFERFAASLYRYGHTAGMCFAPKQGGPFASPRIAQLVEEIRQGGAAGVAQSSWGPTLFVAQPSAAAAAAFVASLQSLLAPADRVTIAEPNNLGARIARVAAP
jgi:beta-ribofuranosylaminobenzene 5'-phosphate synthase